MSPNLPFDFQLLLVLITETEAGYPIGKNYKQLKIKRARSPNVSISDIFLWSVASGVHEVGDRPTPSSRWGCRL